MLNDTHQSEDSKLMTRLFQMYMEVAIQYIPMSRMLL